MNQSIIKQIILFFLFSQVSLLPAQIEKGELATFGLTTSLMKPNEKHRYTLKLAKDRFVFFKLMQKGVDVAIITYEPDGNVIKYFDSPNSTNGPEFFNLTSTKKGTYTIEIAPCYENFPDGYYELNVETVAPKATLPNKRVDQLFMKWDNDSTPGAAVAIVKNGEVVYKKGYGLANLEYGIPITTSSTFNIASVSKQFTVFSILLLEKEGKLSLEDDIRKYIPEVPDLGQTITLKHLASHTSGLRSHLNLLSLAGKRDDDVITKNQVLNLITKQKELNFDSGEHYCYSNTGYFLLAEVVSRVSGMSFPKFTKENIFEPLNMKNSIFHDHHHKIIKNRTYSYYMDSTGFKKNVLNYSCAGATNLFTTVEDLSSWTMNFSHRVVGDSTIINKMNTLYVLNNGETFGGALGQFIEEYKGLKVISHAGKHGGYRTYLARIPSENLSVIVLSNSGEFNNREITYKVVDTYLSEKLKQEEKKRKVSKKPKAIQVDQKILETYIGDFELDSMEILTIYQKEGQLFVKSTTEYPYPLIAISNIEFVVDGWDAKVVFIPNDGKKVKTIKIYNQGETTEYSRAIEFDKTPKALKEFSGKFYSEELSATYFFEVIDGKLILKNDKLGNFTLYPVRQDLFSSESWKFHFIEFTRDFTGDISGCKITNDRVWNLYFEKVK